VTSRRHGLVATTAVTALLAISACGGSADGGSDDTAAASPNPAARATSTTTSSTREASATPVTGETRSAGAAATASTSTTAFDVGNGLKIKATLASPCVKPGAKQTITIDIGRAGGVAYNSFYSDGKSGGMENFYGGNNGSAVDEKGTWTDTWVVGPTAPAGPVRVDVVAIDKANLRGHEVIEFEVAQPSGRCS
jgi:hypothetical protein